ncbi:MAG: hypothetical protein MK212_10920 [Saprospiraceae bacterium]|nr:hypothetical protein [Saprospiraceae bacterium]
MTKLSIQKLHQLTGHKASIFALSSYTQESLFLSGGGEGWVACWDIHHPERGDLLAKVEGNIFALNYLEAHQLLVIGNMYGHVFWIDINTQTTLKNVITHPKGVFDILYQAPFVYTIGANGNLSKWQVQPNIQILETLDLSNQNLRAIIAHPQRKELIIAASDGNIYILDEEDLTLKQQLTDAHLPSVFTLALSANGRYLLSGGRDAQLKVWSIQETYQLYKSIPAHLSTINHIAFHPQGSYFATASRDKSIKIWDSTNFELLKVINFEKYLGHLRSVNKLYWLPTIPPYLVSASDDRSLVVWKISEII